MAEIKASDSSVIEEQPETGLPFVSASCDIPPARGHKRRGNGTGSVRQMWDGRWKAMITTEIYTVPTEHGKILTRKHTKSRIFLTEKEAERGIIQLKEEYEKMGGITDFKMHCIELKDELAKKDAQIKDLKAQLSRLQNNIAELETHTEQSNKI